MIIAEVVLGSPMWILPASCIVAVLALLVLWSYWTSGGAIGWRFLAGTLKILAVLALAVCLIEPLFSGLRPRPGANLFLVVADNSQSLRLRDADSDETRADRLHAQIGSTRDWSTRLSQDFDVRHYIFDSRVRPVAEFTDMAFDGTRSSLGTTLKTIATRYQNRPVAGVLLFTDGNATDLNEAEAEFENLPPIYPVVLGSDSTERDVQISRISVTQTNFEASPVTVLAEAVARGYPDESLVFQMLNQEGAEVQRHTIRNTDDGEPIVHRFLVRPEELGISFYRVRVFAERDEGKLGVPTEVSEATLENNTRLVMVDRGGGPFRVLYVCGRPNWEFKFLRRAIQADEEVDLVGLIRIAKKEPKFQFRGHQGETTNSLFRGFDNQEDEDAEQYDQPVLLRLGTRDAEELRDGFPKSKEDLFSYHALIIDDLESSFFSQDQLSLIQEFVSQRGGGFMMLGGRESFAGGKHARTPLAELLPVYLDPPRQPVQNDGYRLLLTREGWLQPWMRLRTNEPDEERRLSQMPPFLTLNPIQSIKPGATVLAHVKASDGQQLPGLVVQRFGKGRSAALLVGDMWRWSLSRPDPEENDSGKAWRQTIRWLVAEVPGRVDAEVRRPPNDPTDAVEMVVRVHDEAFLPLDNATVTAVVETPQGNSIELTATPSDMIAGGYTIPFAPREPGPYRSTVTAIAPDGSVIGERQTGWATEPATREFQDLKPNQSLLEKLAEHSGGEIVTLNKLNAFVSGLPNRKIPITEPWIYPLWHQWGILILALACLSGEWGIRRWKGLA